MPAPTIEQLEDQRNLAAQLRDLSRLCHAAEEIRGEERRHRLELEQLHQAHPEQWRQADRRLRVRKAWGAFWPVVVWMLDIGLLYYFLDFYVRDFPSQLRNFCLMLIPGLIVFLEICFASHAAEARYQGDDTAARSWGQVAGIWALAIASGVGVVVWFQSEGFPGIARGIVTFVLFGVTLSAHLTLARAGDRVLDGIAYWRFNTAAERLERRIVLLENEARRREQAATDRFHQYMAGFNRYAQVHGDGRLQAGPFDRVTQEVLHRVFGYAVIQTPNGNPGAHGDGDPAAPAAPLPPPTVPPAVVPGPPSGEAEVAYLREILERSIREQDAEVRP